MSYYYLGSPYSNHSDGLIGAFFEACNAAGLLIKSGIPVFSPIAHAHCIASMCGLDHRDHTIWLPADRPMMDAAKGMIVLMLKGWEESYGLKYEIGVFREVGKPVVYMVPGVVPRELGLLCAARADRTGAVE